MTYLTRAEIDAKFEQMIEYWESLRADDQLPRRDAFKPEKIHKLMPFVTILQAFSPDNVVWRLMGTAIAARIGQDMTGRNIFDYFDDEIRAFGIENMRRFLNQPCGCRTTSVNMSADGRLVLSHNLFLPIVGSSDPDTWMLNLSYIQKLEGYENCEGRPRLGLAPTIDYIDIGFGLADKPVL